MSPRLLGYWPDITQLQKQEKDFIKPEITKVIQYLRFLREK